MYTWQKKCNKKHYTFHSHRTQYIYIVRISKCGYNLIVQRLCMLIQKQDLFFFSVLKKPELKLCRFGIRSIKTRDSHFGKNHPV